MPKQKSFDCVATKNAIQDKLQKESAGLPQDEIESRRRQWLRTSDNAAAKWWRDLVQSKCLSR
jgi:hypothetical protein